MVLFVTILAGRSLFMQESLCDSITIDKDKGKLDVDFTRLYITLAGILGTILSSGFSYFQVFLLQIITEYSKDNEEGFV